MLIVPVQLALLNTLAASAAAATHTPLSRSSRLRNMSSGCEGEGDVRPLPLFIPGAGSIFTAGVVDGGFSGGDMGYPMAPTLRSTQDAASNLSIRAHLVRVRVRVRFDARVR